MTSDDQANVSVRYAFAHLYMRDAIFQVGVWKVLLMPGGAEYLQGMWHRCAEEFEEQARIPPEGLALRAVTQSDHWFILPIMFPLPLELTEAYFGAIAVRPPRRRWFRKNGPTAVRYFLLERGLTGPHLATLRTVLGEWTSTAHLNYGTGPIPLVPSFVESVAAVLESGGAPVGVYAPPVASRKEHDSY